SLSAPRLLHAGAGEFPPRPVGGIAGGLQRTPFGAAGLHALACCELPRRGRAFFLRRGRRGLLRLDGAGRRRDGNGEEGKGEAGGSKAGTGKAGECRHGNELLKKRVGNNRNGTKLRPNGRVADCAPELQFMQAPDEPGPLDFLRAVRGGLRRYPRRNRSHGSAVSTPMCASALGLTAAPA